MLAPSREAKPAAVQICRFPRLKAFRLRVGFAHRQFGSRSRLGAAGSVADLGQMLGHVGHRFGGAGEFARSFVAAGFEVTPRGGVEIAPRPDVCV